MKKQISALLAFALLFSGCSAQSGTDTSASQSASQAEPIVAMGRYIEKDMNIPEFKNRQVAYLLRGSINSTPEGKLVVHARGDLCQTFLFENGEWGETSFRDEEMLKPVSQKYLGKDESYFRSEDSAKPFIIEKIMMGTGELIGPDGYTFTTATYSYSEADSINQPQKPEKTKTEHFCVSYNGTDAKYYDIPELTNRMKGMFGGEENFINAIPLRISNQNVLICGSEKEYIFYDLSADGGKRLGALPALEINTAMGIGMSDYVAIIDDTVLAANESGAEIYTLSTGEKMAQVALEDIQKVCEGVDGAFYALNKEGIYRILPSGGIVQRVMDGSCYTYAAPAFNVKDFRQDKDGSFYVFGSNNYAPKLLKYEFSQNTPLEREKTLHLWSLRDSPTIREAAAEYMRQNPEVKVYIEIVPKDTELQKATEDLVSTLLAGTGPDLIITDGIDLAKLDAQSVLAPISTEVNLVQYDKRLLPYGQLNNRQIAIGTRLFVSNGSLNDVSQKHTGPLNIEELLNKAKAKNQTIAQMQQAAGKDYMINPLLAYTSFDDAFNAVYTASSAEIWKNGFNKAAAETALQLLAEINSKFMYSAQDYAVSPINSLFEVTASPYPENLYTAGLYGKANAVLSRMIAYSANTQNEDLCIAFINAMLSDYVQTAQISDALPVTETIKLTSLDKDYKEIIQNVFALDCLVRQNTGEVLQLSADAIQIITENYARDDGFKAIVYDYVDGKIDLDTALTKAAAL